MTHVDDWLDSIPANFSDEGEAYARWWLEHHRMPAWKISLYRPMMKSHRLFCTYKETRMRCTGVSRLGDVWLASDHNTEYGYGYDVRVDVTECSNWSPNP